MRRGGMISQRGISARYIKYFAWLKGIERGTDHMEYMYQEVLYTTWKLKKCWIFYEQFLLPQKQNQCKYQKKKMQNTFNKCVKGEWRQFARLVYLGAAPSSGGHLLHHAKTVNLINLLLLEYYHQYYLLCGPAEYHRDIAKITGCNQSTLCEHINLTCCAQHNN